MVSSSKGEASLGHSSPGLVFPLQRYLLFLTKLTNYSVHNTQFTKQNNQDLVVGNREASSVTWLVGLSACNHPSLTIG